VHEGESSSTLSDVFASFIDPQQSITVIISGEDGSHFLGEKIMKMKLPFRAMLLLSFSRHRIVLAS
jgi:hypothetical protein